MWNTWTATISDSRPLHCKLYPTGGPDLQALLLVQDANLGRLDSHDQRQPPVALQMAPTAGLY